MSARRLVTDLPAELRQQIFTECFKVQEGYAYNAKSEKLRNASDDTPIDLSLMYTCRSIAKDCKQLPLTVNTVHFSTVYREDWRSVAGCFNLAATYYRVLQEDIVLHLAHLLTPEMYEQLEKDFPYLRLKLEEARIIHLSEWHADDDLNFTDTLDNANAPDHAQPTACEFVRSFYNNNVGRPGNESPSYYLGYAQVHQTFGLSDIQRPARAHLRIPDPDDYQSDKISGESHRCLIQVLSLIAYQYPKEFADHVYLYLPHWRDRYPAEDFLHLQLGLEWWVIPSRLQVANLLQRLGVPDFVWKLPDMWSYDISFDNAVDDNVSQGHFSEEYEHPTLDFKLRTRERIRFSAAAAAIRFIGLLPYHQRMQLRTIRLYEDLPAVNIMSLHGQGLVRFLRENTLLKVERRVSVVDCIMNLHRYPAEFNRQFFSGGSYDRVDQRILPNLSCWLLDALSVADAGIPVGSFSLLLDSGPYANACTEAFDKFVHGSFARIRAWKYCLEAGLVRRASEDEILEKTYRLSPAIGFEKAIMQLVDRSSAVLQCNFNPGLPQDYHVMVDKVTKWCARDGYDCAWKYWDTQTYLGSFKLPDHYNGMEYAVRLYDVESMDHKDREDLTWMYEYQLMDELDSWQSALHVVNLSDQERAAVRGRIQALQSRLHN